LGVGRKMSKVLNSNNILIVDLLCESEFNYQERFKGVDAELAHIAFQKDNFKNPTKFKEIDSLDFNGIYKEAFDLAFKEVITLGNHPIEGNRTLADLLCLSDGKSLWYYFRFMLLYKHRRRLFEKSILTRIESLKADYHKVYILHESSYLHSLLLNDNEVSSVLHQKPSKKSIKNIFTFIAISACRFGLGLGKLHLLLNKSRKNIMLSNAAAEQMVLSKESLSLKKGDHFTEYLQERVEKENDFINISEFFPPSLGARNQLAFKWHYLKSRFKHTLPLETVLYLQILNPWFYLRARKEVNSLKAAFKLIFSDTSIHHDNTNLLGEMNSYKRLCYFIAVRKAALSWLFKSFDFKSVVSTNEHDSRVKSIQEISSKFKTTSYGIQHGVIHYRHLHYCFSEADRQYLPFPHFTFLWGDYWNKAIQSFSAYDSKSLLNVGQVRTDIITEINKISRANLFPKLDAKKHTILFPSQPLYVGEEKMRERLAKDFLQLSIDFPHFQFIVKPHPHEPDCKQFFNQIAVQMGAENYHILQDDLYKLLSYTNVVMIYNSTVGAEAIYFNKPLVVMNYAENDFSGFIKSGVASEVNDYEMLKGVIEKSTDATAIADIDAQQRFIQERAYKIDGQVSDRIISTVRNNER